MKEDEAEKLARTIIENHQEKATLLGEGTHGCIYCGLATYLLSGDHKRERPNPPASAEGERGMMAAIFIEPHERFEAVEAYKDRLTANQIEQIEDAPEGALIRLSFGVGEAGTTVTVIEEG